jgi:RNA polymerase sigma factor for flagellar operon FliA
MTAASAYASPPNDQAEIEQRIRTHMQLVRKIAWQIHGRVRDVFEIDDLVQIGMVALVEAAKRFQDLGQASFSSYAAVRIRGALTDHLRKNLTLTSLLQRKDPKLAAYLGVGSDYQRRRGEEAAARQMQAQALQMQTERLRQVNAASARYREQKQLAGINPQSNRRWGA